jgi:hypothetical protein
MNNGPPETPEAAAFELLKLIREAEGKDSGRRSNVPARTEILDLFVECLMAARGERGRADGATLH